MHRVLLILLALGIAACASTVPKKESASTFSLLEIEGVVPADGEVWMDGWKFWVGVVVAKPEEFKGRTVVFRFKSAEDPNYRLLTSNYGRSFRITAQDGEGVVSRGVIVFMSDRPASFTMLPEKKPNQSPEPTAGLRPAAAHL